MNVDTSKLKPGVMVVYRPVWGKGQPTIATLSTPVEPHKGQYAVSFKEGNWAYTYQIDRIIHAPIEMYDSEHVVFMVDHKNQQAFIAYKAGRITPMDYHATIDALDKYSDQSRLVLEEEPLYRTFYTMFLEYAANSIRSNRQVNDTTLQAGIDFFRANGIEVVILD